VVSLARSLVSNSSKIAPVRVASKANADALQHD
jgi:hypothetical protein